MSDEIGTNVSWTTILEEYFKATGEKAHALSLLHKRSEALYSHRKAFIDLPVIIGSGVVAFLNAGSSTLFTDSKISSIALGIGSLSLGVLNSVGTYYGWAKRSEGHRISSIHYARLYRFLAIEMGLPREERMTPHDLLKHTKEQYDRLAEISPLLPNEAIREFKFKFKDVNDVAKPEEANGLERISIFPESLKTPTLATPKKNSSRVEEV